MRRIRHIGVTLIELCFALAVLAALAGLAIPAFRSALRESAVRSAAYELMAGVQQTRASSIVEGRRGVLCLTDTAGICRSSPASAWSAYLETGGVPLPLAARVLPKDVEIHGTRARLEFWPAALAAAAATLTICDSQQIARPRAIVISQTGRARLAIVPGEACRS